MASRIIGLGALGLACVVAAGGGAFLAVRQAHNAGQPTAIVTPAQPVSAQSGPGGLVSTPPAAADVAPPAAAAEPGSPFAAHEDTARTPARTSTPSLDRRASRPRAPAARTAPADAPTQDAPRTTATQVDDPPVAPPTAAAPAQASPPPPAEPQREFVEVTVPSESVLGLQVQTAVSSETARVEDRVEARVTRDVRVNDRIAIPSGSEVLGSVVQVDRGGKVKERAHVAIRFHTLVLPDGTRTSLAAEAVHREGPSPANKSAAKIGGATVGGAILGAILGGGKGAAIGGGIGAAGGTAATMAGDRQPATIAAGSIVNVRLMSPLTVTLER